MSRIYTIALSLVACLLLYAADPLPKPKQFDHADPYPNFGIWGWSAISNNGKASVAGSTTERASPR